jgi:NTE family protein
MFTTPPGEVGTRERAMAAPSPQRIDDKDVNLVLEGGGVKGIGLIGALSELDGAGFRIRRVAGTSAGAIAAALVAANLAAGKPLAGVKDQISSIDYKKFTEESMLRRSAGPLGDLQALMTKMGLYSGDYLVEWLGGILDDLGVTTFSQLRRDDLGDAFPYSLVVHTADITAGKLVRLPRDYPAYGMESDRQRIVDAVRASMAIPFFFEPVTIEMAADGQTDNRTHTATWVDGGLLSNFPMEVFNDLHSGVVVDSWPTVGIKLANQQAELAPPDPTNGPFDETLQILKTVLNNSNRYFVTPEKARSTIFVDSAGLTATDFDITPDQCTTLFENGRTAAQAWLRQLREFAPAGSG